MHSSILSRSVITIAALAVGSVALAATPASAATASDVTRDQVVSLAAVVRAMPADSDYSRKTVRAIDALIASACDFHPDDENEVHDRFVEPVVAGNADGLLISANLHELADDEPDSDNSTHRQCTFAALTTSNAAFGLSGQASLTVTRALYNPNYVEVPFTASSKLAGSVFVTAPIISPDEDEVVGVSFSATGNATRTVNVTSSVRVATPKSKAVRKAARAKYDARLESATNKYHKAIEKAGKSKKKKAAAKQAYASRKATAKTKYKKAIATFKIVRKTTKQVQNRPFTVTATINSMSGI